MRALEFITDLSEQSTMTIPQEVAAQLPKTGRARVIILTDDDPDDALWRAAANEQFLRADSLEDSVYDSYR